MCVSGGAGVDLPHPGTVLTVLGPPVCALMPGGLGHPLKQAVKRVFRRFRGDGDARPGPSHPARSFGMRAVGVVTRVVDAVVPKNASGNNASVR